MTDKRVPELSKSSHKQQHQRASASFGFGFSSATSRPWYPQPSQLRLPSPTPTTSSLPALLLFPLANAQSTSSALLRTTWPGTQKRSGWRSTGAKHWTSLGELTGPAGRTTLGSLECMLPPPLLVRSNFCLPSGFQKTYRNSVSLQPPPFCWACLKPDGFKLTRDKEGGLLEMRRPPLSVTYRCEHPCHLYLSFSGFVDRYPESLQATMVSQCEIQSPLTVQSISCSLELTLHESCFLFFLIFFFRGFLKAELEE